VEQTLRTEDKVLVKSNLTWEASPQLRSKGVDTFGCLKQIQEKDGIAPLRNGGPEILKPRTREDVHGET